MNALTNIVTTGLLAATMLGIGTAGTAIAASEEEKQQKVVEQYNYQLVHEINTEDIYRINGEPCTYEEWIEYMNWIQSLPDGEAVIVIDPDEPTDPTVEPEQDTQIKGLTHASTENCLELMLTEGTEFEWLYVYNLSNHVKETGNGCNSQVILCDKTGRPLPGIPFTSEDCLNLSCIYRDPAEAEPDYTKYMVDCEGRTAPGNFNGLGSWSGDITGAAEVGAYVLHNARIEIVNPSTKNLTKQIYQVIISYDWAQK